MKSRHINYLAQDQSFVHRPFRTSSRQVDSKGIICYPWSVNQKLSDPQIEATCRELLLARRHVTLRQVSEELRRRYGACGKNARVAWILRETAERTAVPHYQGTPEAEIVRLQATLDEAERRIAAAIARAELSEERERSHQDLWAQRFAERMEENERRIAAAIRRHQRESAEEQLRLYQRIAELERENARLTLQIQRER